MSTQQSSSLSSFFPPRNPLLGQELAGRPLSTIVLGSESKDPPENRDQIPRHGRGCQARWVGGWMSGA